MDWPGKQPVAQRTGRMRELDMSGMQGSRNGEKPLRVLWISEGCSLQDQEGEPGLSGRMESVVARYRGNRIRLGVAYMADGTHESRLTRNGIDY